MAATLLVVHVVWFTGVAAAGVEPERLALIGSHFLDKGRGASVTIDSLRGHEVGPTGYDGQFALFTALDPVGARSYLDIAAYRYGRILYPLVARAAAGGQQNAVPWVLLLINILAAAVLTFCVALLLEQGGVCPWFALLTGLSPGLNVGVVRDLTEPLGYGLAALGFVIFASRNDRKGLLVGVLAFALAGLARETALLFAVAVAVSLALGIPLFGGSSRRRRVLDSTILLCGALAPTLVWRLAVSALVGEEAVPPANRLELIPLRGLIARSFGPVEVVQLLVVVIPAALAVLAVLALAEAGRRKSTVCIALAVNLVVLVLLLPEASYADPTPRLTLGVLLAFNLCLPLVRRGVPRLFAVLLPGGFWYLSWLHVGPEFVHAITGGGWLS